MKSLKQENWTMYHSFYADMGGFMLQLKGQEPFPVNTAHIIGLIRQGILPTPDITKEAIYDKSKANGLAKAIICVQITWSVMQCIG